MNILMYLFSKSISRVDELIFAITLTLFVAGRYKEGLVVVFGGGILVAIIETLLKI